MAYIFYCNVFPAFSFLVPELRRLRESRGQKNASCVVQFNNGMLHTELQGYDDEEAACIAQAVRARINRPIFGTDIVEQTGTITGNVPHGRWACEVCALRFETIEGKAMHQLEKHVSKPAQKPEPLLQRKAS